MPVLNNCNEVIDFMCENYFEPYVGYGEFQGDKVEFCGMPANGDVLIRNPNRPFVAFLVSFPKDDVFYLQIVKGWAILDEFPTVILPAYVCNEMMCTLKGLNTHSELHIREVMSLRHCSRQEAIEYLDNTEDNNLPF